jgi:hypothetical protein
MAPNPKNLLDSAVALGGKAVSAASRALGRDGDDKRDDLTSEPPENVKPVSVPRAGGAKTGKPAARSTATARRKAAAKPKASKATASRSAAKPSGSATAASGSKRPAAAKSSSTAAKAKGPAAKPAAAKKSGAAGASRTSGATDKGVSGDSGKA